MFCNMYGAKLRAMNELYIRPFTKLHSWEAHLPSCKCKVRMLISAHAHACQQKNKINICMCSYLGVHACVKVVFVEEDPRKLSSILVAHHASVTHATKIASRLAYGEAVIISCIGTNQAGKCAHSLFDCILWRV